MLGKIKGLFKKEMKLEEQKEMERQEKENNFEEEPQKRKLSIFKRKEKEVKTAAGKMLDISKTPRELKLPSFAHLLTAPAKAILIPADAKEATYPLIRPYAYANIKFDEKEGILVYSVIEPVLTAEEQATYEKLKDGLIQVIDVPMGAAKNEQALLDFLEDKVKWLIKEYGVQIDAQGYIKIMYYIFRDFVGLNQLEPLLRDPLIEDISCDGFGIPLYVVHRRFGSIKTNVIFKESKQLTDFVVKLAERCDRYISYAEPLLDGTLPSGSRVQASLAEDVTTRGPTFSIRKFTEKPFTPIDMLRVGTADAKMLSWLWFVVENGANILISGATATGKTTFLNVLCMFTPSQAKIVSIEDTREISLVHENWLPAVARTGFGGTGVGEVTMYDLLKESFRQNPDYLVVGEVRAEEANVMFQAMSSGIIAMSTMHAGSVEGAIRRLQTRPISLPPTLMNSLDVLIVMSHAREKGQSARRVKEIVEIENVEEDGTVHSKKVFTWNAVHDSYEDGKESHMLKKIADQKGYSKEFIQKELKQREHVLEWLFETNPDWKEVVRTILLYDQNKKAVLDVMKSRHIERTK